MMKRSIELEKIRISADGSHHALNGIPLYSMRYERVLNYHGNGLASAKDTSGAFHIGLDGMPVYNYRYERTFGFYEGLASVMKADMWFHILSDGNPTYDERYSWTGNFQDGRCSVRDQDQSYFHITAEGKPAYKERYRYVGDFKESAACVYDQDGYAFHILEDGSLLHDQRFLELDVYHKGYAIASNGKGYFHIDRRGEPIYRERYLWVEPFYNGLARVKRNNSVVLLINEEGKEIKKITSSDIDSLNDVKRGEIMDMMIGYWYTQILRSIIELGIIEDISSGTETVERLQSSIGIDSRSLHMILQWMTVYDFIRIENEEITLTSKGKMLVMEEKSTLGHAAIMWGSEHYQAMANLTDSLKQYKPMFKDVYGKDYFDYLDSNESSSETYQKALESYTIDYEDIVPFLDLSDTNVLMDIGGGNGSLLNMILKANPQISRGIVFDRPPVIEAIATNHERTDEISIEYLQGDFFDEIPSHADTIIISRIIHDWDDDSCIQILRNVHGSLPPEGRLVIFDTIIPEQPRTDIGISLNFNLLVMLGGRERRLKEFEAVLRSSGFMINNVIRGAGIISILSAIKS